MTIAILKANGDLIWFDAITTFSERYAGNLTAHPLERGGIVNDHVTIENIEITLNGIISDADFNLDRPVITDDDGRDWKINNKEFVNNSPVLSTVQIGYTPGLSRFLPESASQFITPDDPVVTVVDAPRPKFAVLIKDELTAIQRNAENFSLVDFQDGRIWRVIDNCVLTSLDFTETPDSGDAVYPLMTIKVARYATTKAVVIKRVMNKGRKSLPAVKRETKAGDDARNAGTSFSQPAQVVDPYSGFLDAPK